ncbi:hypothetical protein HCR_07040 [Hydrogenimonas cancrithermarum]|uniref:Restriction endonuclease type IV Mrr domain-containing protein n=2 Tax=Hydrogenimonas cancrithermarum TaxID=2993563 RepID=A0ABM8FJD3_9BACT|nr:hypothetical protein HCR_07040 [Hydrogenimonas cancrithermarum]
MDAVLDDIEQQLTVHYGNRDAKKIAALYARMKDDDTDTMEILFRLKAEQLEFRIARLLETDDFWSQGLPCLPPPRKKPDDKSLLEILVAIIQMPIVIFAEIVHGLKVAADPQIAAAPHPLEKGKNYELFIGLHHEKNGGLVIYNGQIRGFEDKGVDLVYISPKNRTLDLVQCKHWDSPMERDLLPNVYKKLSAYDFDFVNLDASIIVEKLQIATGLPFVEKALNEFRENKGSYKVRKIFYIARGWTATFLGGSTHETGKGIYCYKDMKIVVQYPVTPTPWYLLPKDSPYGPNG